MEACGYRICMDDSDGLLRALDDDRLLLSRCLDALEESTVAAERADLARATALLAARYENVLSDSLYLQLVESLGAQRMERAEQLLARMRTAVATVRNDVRGVTPIDAHMSDPDGLEADIALMSDSVRALLDYEDAELFRLVELLDPQDVENLRRRINIAVTHQTSLPNPPGNRLIRRLAAAIETIGLVMNDESTTWHSGTKVVLDRSKSAR